MNNPNATDTPASEAATATDHHAPTDHGVDHGHDDHGHQEEALGPVDVAAWSAGILGVGVAVVMAACFALATMGIG